MRAKNGIFMLATLLLICVVSLCIGGTVRGREQDAASETFYRLREAELLRDTREYLQRSGFPNSGITLTRVIDGEGHRDYTFTIHHGRIDRMDEGERQILQNALSEFGSRIGSDFPEEFCTFHHEFLIVESMR